MKALVVAVVAAIVAVVVAGCAGLPTLTPPPPSPTDSGSSGSIPMVAISVGLVYVRYDSGVLTGEILTPGQTVIVYGQKDGWCYTEASHIKKVWCGCVGIGDAACKSR